MAPAAVAELGTTKSAGAGDELVVVPQGMAPQTPAAAPTPSMPRHLVRRLMGSWLGEHGPGGSSSVYLDGTILGRGTYGTVRRKTLFGIDLAIKTFQEHDRMEAVCECSIAETLRGHDHIVFLMDATVHLADRTTMLVYEYAGYSLDKILARKVLAHEDCTQVAKHLFAGLGYMHSKMFFHADIKPANLMCKVYATGPADVLGFFPNGLWLRIGDLGSAVEVQRGPTVLDRARTTMWYRSPEHLQGSIRAVGAAWLSNDVWAAGLVLCQCVGVGFHMVRYSEGKNAKRCAREQLEALTDAFDSPGGEGCCLKLPGGLATSHGSAFLDLLRSTVAWTPEKRRTASSAGGHVWFHTDRMRTPAAWPATIPGHRHPWSVLQATMSPEVLEWLRAELPSLTELKAKAQLQECEGGKWVLSGKMVPEPGSEMLNALPIKHMMPLARVVAWVRAWREANALAIGKLHEDALSAVMTQAGGGARFAEDLPEGVRKRLGDNGKHFVTTQAGIWCLTAGQVHIFDSPAELTEPLHFDGGASVLHMGITLYGRRDVRCLFGENPEEGFSLEMSPGSVYLGGFTGPKHQVIHRPPCAPEEVLHGHSVSIMLRTTLFPASRSRCMANVPAPAEMFRAMAASFATSLHSGHWCLPTLAGCETMMALP